MFKYEESESKLHKLVDVCENSWEGFAAASGTNESSLAVRIFAAVLCVVICGCVCMSIVGICSHLF